MAGENLKLWGSSTNAELNGCGGVTGLAAKKLLTMLSSPLAAAVKVLAAATGKVELSAAWWSGVQV